ncbi:hypothetical protein VNO78_20058 [Psophocarpus tetragonolobus]|uniref:Protein PIN-LIKES 3 n=1 Tax=Psophocarpus tetragonolobus TaxID=3891 RepID=A0AAN9XGV3_PSOTE
MQLWKLFITALMPVLKVLLITAVGAFLALPRVNILRKSARKHLNTIVYYVFLPALVCSTLAKSITFRSLVMLWFMPLNVLFTFIIGRALGWLLMKIIKAPPDMQGLVLGCCAAGNLGNLPLIIVPAVCKERNCPFGAGDVCNGKGMAYASLSLAIGNIYIWSFVYNIIRVYSCQILNVKKIDDSEVGPGSAIQTDLENHSSGQVVIEVDHSETNDHVTTLPGVRAKVRKQKHIMKPFKTLVEKLNLKVLLAPATIGSIIGIIICVVPPLRKMFVGSNAPLRVVEDSASMLGDASIPAVTLLIGANLLNGLKRSGMKLSLVVGIIVVRYIGLPILGVAIVKGAIHFGVIHHDPLYQFILLLQYALPPAVSISTITQLFGAGETECSIVMLATYACASFALTLWITFFITVSLVVLALTETKCLFVYSPSRACLHGDINIKWQPPEQWVKVKCDVSVRNGENEEGVSREGQEGWTRVGRGRSGETRGGSRLSRRGFDGGVEDERRLGLLSARQGVKVRLEFSGKESMERRVGYPVGSWGFGASRAARSTATPRALNLAQISLDLGVFLLLQRRPFQRLSVAFEPFHRRVLASQIPSDLGVFWRLQCRLFQRLSVAFEPFHHRVFDSPRSHRNRGG